MINPISFLWRQFNGPQISAFCNAIWEYFNTTYSQTLAYLGHLTIESANTHHLSLLGALQGLARPLVPIPKEDELLFTNDYGYKEGYGVEPATWYAGHLIPDAMFPSNEGVSSLHNPSVGGKFQQEGSKTGYSYITDYIFRALLRAVAHSEGYLGGLTVLDDMLYEVYRTDYPSETPKYKFVWTNRTTHQHNSPADIIVDMGSTYDWANPYMLYAEINLLGDTVYYPIPRLIPSLTIGD